VRALPSGTVTFLFTDIEGSTRLLHELGDRYADVLAEHRRIIRDAFGRHGGVEVDTQGDAFFVAFDRASEALAAAAEAQTALAAGPVQVRMGLHTGEPTATDEGYVGIDVHRAARIAASGHGGQVLLSQSTHDLVSPDGLRDLGEHRLKDLSAPERIYQLGDDEFPPLKTLYATNLPVAMTPFLGRTEELATVAELLDSPETRLLTLAGAGGSGKTRLALQAAAAAADHYPHGVWWVPLASVSSASAVFQAAAQAFGGGAPLAEIVGERRMLLLLDNFEHVIDAAADLPALLGTCRNLDLLVTSRERLRVQGEHVYPVPVLARAEARELFVSRAREAEPSFEPDALIEEICARLDDLPLALELAAARVGLLPTEQLLERLGGRLDLLRGGRDAELRQRTLRATIEWSYDLLDTEERRVLASLSVFRGGWTITAAERVCDTGLDVLESLVDKSLVRRWEADRFGMLETIREFAAEQLEPADRHTYLRRLAERLLELAEDANLYGEAQGSQRPELVVPERTNVDAALAWSLEAGEIALGLRLIWLLELHLVTGDPLAARAWVDAFLARAGESLDTGLRARAVRVRGATYDMTGQYSLSRREYEEARALFLDAGDEEAALHVLHRIAMSTAQLGDMDRAAILGAEILELDRRRGRRRDEAVALNLLGFVAHARGDHEYVRLMRESADLAGEVGFDWWRGVTLGNLGYWLLEAGELDEAERALAPAAEVIARIDDRVNVPFTLACFAWLAAARGDAYSAGMLWGAIERGEELRPTPAWTRQHEHYREKVETAAGPEFERGRTHGRTLSYDEALDLIRDPGRRAG